MARRLADGTYKLDMNEVEQSLREELKANGRRKLLKKMERLQLAIYVACSCSFLGCSGAERPSSFYIDMRVGKLPYKKRHIEQAVDVLALHAKVLGIAEPLPFDRDFHGCGGVF